MPSPRHHHTFALAALACLAACQAPTAPPFSAAVGSDFVLAPGETATVRGAGFSLTFVRVVSEGRCPTNPQVQCVWEGTATLQLRVHSASGAREVPIETHTRANTTSVDGYLVRVVELTPTPPTQAAIPADRYRLTLRVIEAR